MTGPGSHREFARLTLIAAAAIVAVAASLEALDRESPFHLDVAAPAARQAKNKSDTGATSRIIVSRPKVWQYERVEALMDGLLRDIEGVSLRTLTELDPNAANATSLDFLQTAFAASVKYDQAAGIKFRNDQAAYALNSVPEQAKLEDYNARLAILRQERLRLTGNYLEANKTVSELAGQKAAGSISPADEQRLVSANASATTLKAQLDSMQAMIDGAGAAPQISTPSTPNSTAAPDLGASAASFGQFLGALPDDLKKTISDGIKQPNYPATKKLENFLTLLRERLAAEVSVLQDDVARSPEKQVFLMQFDVGVYPANEHKEHMANVEYIFDNCGNCSVYAIYPGQSSYNVANYAGSSRRNKFTAILGWIGFGLNAEYQRQRDQLQSSLVQSVYAAGYQSSNRTEARVGWHYYPAPFEQYITPGQRSTFALVSMSKESLDTVSMRAAISWSKRKEPERPAQFESLLLELPAMVPERHSVPAIVVRNDAGKLHVLRMEYNPVTYVPGDKSTEPDPLSRCAVKQCTAVMLGLDMPVDANLVVTVRGRPLRRVRDWRGRATAILPPAQDGSANKALARSLIERDDLEADSWYQVSSHEIMLNISRALAGASSFPSISLSDPSHPTVLIPYDLGLDHTEVVVSGFRMVPRAPEDVRTYAERLRTESSSGTTSAATHNHAPLRTGPYPFATFLPLFVPTPYTQRIFAYVGETGDDLLIGMAADPVDAITGRPVPRARWLETRTRVILEDRELDFAWSLNCATQGLLLNCEMPLSAIRDTYLNAARVCPSREDCPSAWPSLELVGVPAVETLWQAMDAAKTAVARTAAMTSLKPETPIGITSLQVWVAQYDPDERPGLESAEPATLPFVALAPADQPRPMRYTGYNASSGNVSASHCGVLAGMITRLKLLGSTRPTIELARTKSGNCATTQIPLDYLSRSPLVFAADVASGSLSRTLTFTIQTDSLLPDFGEHSATPLQALVKGVPVTTKWNLEWAVTRVACGDAVQVGAQLSARHDVTIGWSVGAEDNLNPCSPGRGDAFLNGQARLRISVPRDALPLIPAQLTLLRQRIPSGTTAEIKPLDGTSSLSVATTDFARLLLPTSLTINGIGDSGFVLRGRQAGEIGAVLLQKDGGSTRKPASASGTFAQVSLDGVKPGRYVVVPVVSVSPKGPDLPLLVTGADGNELTIEVPKPAEKAADDKLPNKSTTRTTVTTESSANASASTVVKPKPKP